MFEYVCSNISIHESYPIDYLVPLKSLWQDQGVQKTFDMGHTFAFNENIK